MSLRFMLLASLAPLIACTADEAEPARELVQRRGLAGCPEDQDCASFRAVGGISMGGGAAMRIGLENPELFDAVVSLGAPYIDLEYFFTSVGEVSNGGFCGRDQLLQNLALIDTKDAPETWCGPVHFKPLAIEGSTCDGFSGDFNHHYRGPEAGRGGSFNRESSFEIVHDLALAYGNPAFYSPDSEYLPPGVDLSSHVALALDDSQMREARRQRREEVCANGRSIDGFVDSKFNPDGAYPVITFCDGNGPTNGEYEPGLAHFPVEVTLAIDYNENGRRDYGEPVLSQGFEPYDDVGVDRLANVDEPGFDAESNPDPNGDDHDWLTNPSGTEANFRFDAGEPTDDAGLDGVIGTNDFGEANGRFDLNPNVEYAFSRSPRKILEGMSEAALSRMHLYVDAGIRDFLLSAQISNQFWGALRSKTSQTQRHDDWSGLAEAGGAERYDPYTADLSEEAVGRHVYLRYGDPSVCPGVDAETGRGNHVGSASEVVDRISTAFAFASARWRDGDLRRLPGSISEQGSPNGSIEDFLLIESFESEALDRQMPYVTVLPPDYYSAPDKSYPVMYFLHGQGQQASDLAAVALIILGPQMDSQISERKRAGKADLQKMIVVFADGNCAPGECHTGTFYLDHKGVDGDGPRHGEAFFELMRTIEMRYRTKVPAFTPTSPE